MERKALPNFLNTVKSRTDVIVGDDFVKCLKCDYKIVISAELRSWKNFVAHTNSAAHKNKCCWMIKKDGILFNIEEYLPSKSIKNFFSNCEENLVAIEDTDSESEYLSDDPFLAALDGHRSCQTILASANKSTETDRDDAVSMAFEKYPLLKKSLDNIVKRKDFCDTSSRSMHDEEILLFYAKHALQYNVASSLDIANQFGGPKKSTLYNLLNTDPIPVWLSPSLIQVQLKTFSEICMQQGSETRISAFLCMDGTALSTRFDYKILPDSDYLIMLTGLETPLDVPIFLNRTFDSNKNSTYSDTYKGMFKFIRFIIRLKLSH